MHYVVWDCETDSAVTSFATMLEVGALCLDSEFKQVDQFEARCRLPQDRIPTATALCINKSNVDLLTKGNYSHYQMIGLLEQTFREWAKKYGPLTFLGYSSINFDDEVLRKELFKSLRKPYLTNTEGNMRTDALNIVRAAFAIDDNILKTELNNKGNKSMKLESLSRLNDIDSIDAHSALADTIMTVKVLNLIKAKQPNIWQEYFKTSSKIIVENIIKQEKIFTIQESFYGKHKLFCCAPLHPKACDHPVYKGWFQAVDLKADIELIQQLDYSDLKREIKKSPKFLRTIRSNKAPIILDQSYSMKVEPYNKIDPNILMKRAELMKTNEKFSTDILNILKDAADEKRESGSQEYLEPEETLYTDGFKKLNEDAFLFDEFHQATWKDKLRVLNKFKDERLIKFGQQLIYNETPDVLPKEIHKKIKRKIAERIFSTNNEKWTTLEDFHEDWRNIYENEDKMFSFKSNDEKMKFLDGIKDYVDNIEQKYMDV